MTEGIRHQSTGVHDVAWRVPPRARRAVLEALDRHEAGDYAGALHSLGAVASLLRDREGSVVGTEARPGRASQPTLSTRQHQILTLVAGGASNRQIAVSLRLSENTVKWHLKRIYRELDVDNRCAALSRASQLGLITTSI